MRYSDGGGGRDVGELGTGVGYQRQVLDECARAPQMGMYLLCQVGWVQGPASIVRYRLLDSSGGQSLDCQYLDWTR